ncbi:hypothetical protein N7508_005206 [Penicillium antarcticum]|uniref:uncharacterized protein n=1 Tax=Penicillium antarcticum TaxID=416450 RepID=UPI0023A350A0|nr:uncharacterized protein N7508_005206 [Penicillium antarcticum]KAJ5306191.1 hypothetical protein N7508_005206 [Penicillium antarcticum]
MEWTDFARVNCISPHFIMTDMRTKQPKELFKEWMAINPGRRICDPAELKSLCTSFRAGLFLQCN